jgi:hypothetical protein
MSLTAMETMMSLLNVCILNSCSYGFITFYKHVARENAKMTKEGISNQILII